MAASGPDRGSLAGEIVLALTAGASFTLLLGLLRAAQMLPGMTNMLLRPGGYVAGKLGANGLGGVVLSVLGDAVFYGAIPFLFLWMKRGPARPRSDGGGAERRRAPRIAVAMPVFVYGRTSDEPFVETTQTVNVSAVGGLMQLEARVAPPQKLLLINTQSDEEVPCRVVRAVRGPDRRFAIGFEFLRAGGTFWKAGAAESAEVRRDIRVDEPKALGGVVL
jgi:hypothetical protein